VTEHKNVYSALAAAQAVMRAPVKGSSNPAFKSKYADLWDVMQAVLPPLNAEGLALFHQVITADGQSYMRAVLVHGASDTQIWCDVPLIVDRQNMQGFKSATTYAKRIGTESITGVAPADDDDGNAAAKAPPKDDAPSTRGPTAMQIAAESLAGAETLDQLSAIWKDLPRSVQGEKIVIAAKDKRKAELQSPADLGDDEIPY
jgi:hypothetical protein